MKVKTITIVVNCDKLPHYDDYDAMHTTSRLDNSNVYEAHQLLDNLKDQLIWSDWPESGTYDLMHPASGVVAGTITLEEAE